MTKTKNIEPFQITKDWGRWKILAEKIKMNLVEVKNGYLDPDSGTDNKNEEAE
jgi:hypothetical protein